MQVKRALGWGLMFQGDGKQAVHVYGQVLASDSVVPSDYLNMGYAHWLMGNVEQARDSFRQFLSVRKSEGDDKDGISAMFKEDSSLLDANNIGFADRAIMVSLIEE